MLSILVPTKTPFFKNDEENKKGIVSWPWIKFFQGLLNLFDTPYEIYTPVLTANVGVFTSASIKGKFKQVGKLVFIRLQIIVVTQGTATHAIITLPVPANADMHQAISGVEIAINGKGCTGEVGFGNNFSKLMLRNDSDGTPTCGDGTTTIISGHYEAA